MESLAHLISAIAWPAIFVGGGWLFRREISDLYFFLRRTIAAGGALKFAGVELRGIEISSIYKEGKTFRRMNADQELLALRNDSYAKNKNLFLVHQAKPTGKDHPRMKIPTYDVSVYLIPHKNFGRLNDVKEVEYYFGRHFGFSESAFGSKFVVENGSEAFAVKVNAYGPMLCEARICFHDGSDTTVSRYLDFEGSGYRSADFTNEEDIKKLSVRTEMSNDSTS